MLFKGVIYLSLRQVTRKYLTYYWSQFLTEMNEIRWDYYGIENPIILIIIVIFD